MNKKTGIEIVHEFPPALVTCRSQVQEKMWELHGPLASSNDIAQWANAMILCAGSLFGQIHEQQGVPTDADQTVAQALAHNILCGIEVGRKEVKKTLGVKH